MNAKARVLQVNDVIQMTLPNFSMDGGQQFLLYYFIEVKKVKAIQYMYESAVLTFF